MPYTELVIGLVGAVGTNLNVITEELVQNFSRANCETEVIKLTDYIKITNHKTPSYLELCKNKIQILEEIRETNPGFLSYLAISKIFLNRFKNTCEKKVKVYIINSLKNPHEYAVLRHVYRRNFLFLSIYSSRDMREKNLKRKELVTKKRKLDEHDELEINKLLDTGGFSNKSSTNTRETYHKAHYFINYDNYEFDLNRFTNLIMNEPFSTPTIDEIGMAHAYVESLKSADLSRQVGAIILNEDGNILASGCNEVPKFGGGLHWCHTNPDLRDFQCHNKGVPLSEIVKQEKIDAIRETLESKEELSKDLISLLQDSLEFIRAVHAEEAAICDAAKRGVSIKNATLYSTTFPCHLCAKHIIAAGIKRVVYIEPYPKSLSEQLFKGLIKDKATKDDINVVKLESFRGVAPKRFRYLFKKYKSDRKSENKVKQWDIANSNPIHVSHSTVLSYFWIEDNYLKVLVQSSK
ncbi:deaminase, partial [Legionella sainthelensi]|uniref:deaminase n=1 Tax=Legionella sainthelensi TaxID=28087 RepID=UPI000E20B3D4